jgi:hypothetical protein
MPQFDRQIFLVHVDFASFYARRQKTLVVNFEDAYCNYRHLLPEVGYMAPFNAHVYEGELRGCLQRDIRSSCGKSLAGGIRRRLWRTYTGLGTL